MRSLLSILLIAMVSGCVSHSVNKVSGIDPGSEICIVRNQGVSLDFFNAYKSTLEEVGYGTKEISAAGECPIYTTYTAQFGHHWGLYLARANFQIYKDGQSIGSATYKAPRADPSKHGKVKGKIEKLVNEMFGQK